MPPEANFVSHSHEVGFCGLARRFRIPDHRVVGEDRPEYRTERRVTLAEAAAVLGTSKGAVRMRVRRGTLRSEKGEDGRVYVFVDPTRDRTRDAGGYGDHPAPEVEGSGEAPLVEELRDRVRFVEEQLREEREARRRADTLLAQLMQRIPELEAPQEARQESAGSPETAMEMPMGPTPAEASEGPQEQAAEERPGFWSRLFGRGG
jgi:hypothetical protein